MGLKLDPAKLDRMRLARKPPMALRQLGVAAGLSLRQLQRLLRGDHDPYESTLIALAGALSCDLEEILVSPPPPPAAATGGRTGEDTTLAKQEVQRGLHEPSIDVKGRRYPVIGFNRLQQCDACYAELEETFAVVGSVRERKAIPPDVAAVLGAEQGRGAGYFRIRRDVAGLRKDGRAAELFVTVYAPRGDDGKRLQRCLESEIAVEVLVEIVVARKGAALRHCFPRCEAESALWPWAFVVTDVIDDD